MTSLDQSVVDTLVSSTALYKVALCFQMEVVVLLCEVNNKVTETCSVTMILYFLGSLCCEVCVAAILTLLVVVDNQTVGSHCSVKQFPKGAPNHCVSSHLSGTQIAVYEYSFTPCHCINMAGG